MSLIMLSSYKTTNILMKINKLSDYIQLGHLIESSVLVVLYPEIICALPYFQNRS